VEGPSGLDGQQLLRVLGNPGGGTVDKLQKELRLLKAYALLSTILFATLIFLAAKGSGKRVKFDEIDAERINIVEPNGKVRLTLSNPERMPGGQMAGVDFTSRAGNRTFSKGGAPAAGLLFFNDEGDECGGLTYESKMIDGMPQQGVYLAFDHYRQNEAVNLMHGEQGGKSRSGLGVFDTGPMMTVDYLRQSNAVSQLKDGPEKDAALKKLSQDHKAESLFAQRLFVGRLAENDTSAVILMDRQSRPRIRMTVDAAGTPLLQFLDEHGKVTYSLTDRGVEKQ
jgi:hypothetical protein